MKKILKSFTLVFFSVWMATFSGCKKEEITTLFTIGVSVINETTAVTGGSVTSDGGADILARGVCWSTGHDPTVADNLTMDGNGSGVFRSNITSLTPSTTFYVRAYATSSDGTAYGNEVTFTTPLTYYPGDARFGAVSFSIGNKAYIGLGSYTKYDNYGDEMYLYYKDFWEWDQVTNVWTRKADYPGNSEPDAACFSIGTKGYIVSLGTELWEYDPATNAWTQKAPLPTKSISYGDVGFSIGNKGYIGGPGVTDSIKVDKYYYSYFYKYFFWEWDQSTNVWIKKADLVGNARAGAVGFSIGSKGYIGTGYGFDGDGILKDFWEWDQTTNVWTKKTDFGGNARSGAVGFTIGNKGYIGTGSERGGNSLKDFWEWDQTTDLWTMRSDFKGNARDRAVGLSIGNKGYIGTGEFNNGSGIRDFWEYDPEL